MGLNDDQRAMLRLLAQRGEEGYDDVAALMGLSVEEVRAKVAEALAQVADEGALAPSQVGAEAPEPQKPPLPPPPTTDSPAEPEPESAVKQEPAAAPEPKADSKSPARPDAPAPAPKPKRSASSRPRVSLPTGNGPRAAIAAALVVLVALIVVLVVGGGDSGSDSSTTTSASASTTTAVESGEEAQGTPTSNNAEVTKAVLKPVDGSDASGAAIFGRVKNSLALQVIAKGLAPTTKGSTEYTVWLAQSAQRMLPLASTSVKADGKIGAQFEVPTEVLAYLAAGTFDQLVITRTANAALEASLAAATKAKRAPAYTGTEVLRGTIIGRIVGAQKRLEEEKEAE